MSDPTASDDPAQTSGGPSAGGPSAGGRDPGRPGDGDRPDGPEASCLPAVVAATLLMGIVAFVTCGITTWILFQSRTDIAVRTLQGYVPLIEQSLLPPEDKAAVIEQLEQVTREMQSEQFTPAQASAVMERLVRLPIPQWGELAAVEAHLEKHLDGAEREAGRKQLSRLRRAVEKELATVIDVNHALAPVTTPDTTSPLGRTLNQPLRTEAVLEVIERARLVGDRCRIPDEHFETVPMSELLRRQLEKARSQGGF